MLLCVTDVCFCPLTAVHCRIPYIQTAAWIERTSHISHTHVGQGKEETINKNCDLIFGGKSSQKRHSRKSECSDFTFFRFFCCNFGKLGSMGKEILNGSEEFTWNIWRKQIGSLSE